MNPQDAERLLVFTRYPRAGFTKTRLVPALGPEGAALLQQRMTERTIGCARWLRRSKKLEVEIQYTGGSMRSMRQWLGSDLMYRRQSTGDIGTRMHAAFQKAFDEGVTHAVLVGSDIPDLTTEIIGRAFEALRGCDAVLGPARDGGYYLVGLTRPIPELFTGVPWSSPDVLFRTLQIADELDLAIGLLDTLADVDRLEDLPVIEQLLR